MAGGCVRMRSLSLSVLSRDVSWRGGRLFEVFLKATRTNSIALKSVPSELLFKDFKTGDQACNDRGIGASGSGAYKVMPEPIDTTMKISPTMPVTNVPQSQPKLQAVPKPEPKAAPPQSKPKPAPKKANSVKSEEKWASCLVPRFAKNLVASLNSDPG